jgi:hypothetical protein
LSFDEEMHVIGHEAVHDYCKLLFVRRSRNLREHETDDGVRGEERLTVSGAERQ